MQSINKKQTFIRWFFSTNENKQVKLAHNFSFLFEFAHASFCQMRILKNFCAQLMFGEFWCEICIESTKMKIFACYHISIWCARSSKSPRDPRTKSVPGGPLGPPRVPPFEYVLVYEKGHPRGAPLLVWLWGIFWKRVVLRASIVNDQNRPVVWKSRHH